MGGRTTGLRRIGAAESYPGWKFAGRRPALPRATLAALATAAALAHAAAAPESPAGGRVVDLSLAADEAVPRLSVARAAVTTVTFLDADGAPWPISTLHVSGRRPDGGARAQPPACRDAARGRPPTRGRYVDARAQGPVVFARR